MAIIVVQKQKVTGSSTVSVAYASNTTAGNLLVAVGASDANATISITGGGTWTQAVNQKDGFTAAQAQAAIWYMANCPGGAVTVTLTSSGDSHLHIYEISSIVTTSPLDATGAAEDTSGSTSQSISTSGSVAQASEYVIAGFFSWNQGSQTFTASGGYTTEQTTQNAGGDSLGSLDQIFTNASGVQTASCTFGLSDAEVPKVIATFKGTAGGSSGPVAHLLFVRQAANRASTY